MLIQFNFKNYRSFRDEVSLDLTASKEKDFSERVVSMGNEKILPVAALYGANASGKSNVLNAFKFMSLYVLESFKYGDEKEKFDQMKPQPFLFDSSAENEDSSFEVYFTVPFDKTEKVYNYGFRIGKDGIIEEWLNYRAKTVRKFTRIFYRDEESIDFEKIPSAKRENIQVALEKQVLVVSLGAKLKVDKCKLVRDWFLNNLFADFANSISNLVMERVLPDGFVDNEQVRKNVTEFLATFDNSIKGFEVTKLPGNETSENEKYHIEALHNKAGSNDMAKIPLEEESAGTLKMFGLYEYLQKIFRHGGVFVIDELSDRLHPLLVRNIILAFLNPEININHAQLIFSIHNTLPMSKDFFRRDEIWLTEKDEYGASCLYRLSDVKDEKGAGVRKDESYEKRYLYGEYGAIPTLKSFALMRED